LLLFIPFITAASGQVSQAPEFDPHKIIIKLKPNSRLLTRNTADARMARVKQLRPIKGDVATRTRPLPGGVERIFVTEIADGENLEDVLRELAANPDVEYAERDYIMHADDVGAPATRAMKQAPLTPDDPFFNLQWGLQNTGQDYGGPGGVPGMDVNAGRAWEISTGDRNTILAILDTGIVLNSAEFEGRILPGYDFINRDNVPADDDGHGTKIAGIAAATGGNGILIAGMDWNCRVLPVKVLNSQGTGSNSVIASGIVWAADQGARVISLSLGGQGGSQSLAEAVSYAQSHGAIIVASMGNNNSEAPNFPASYPGVIAVGAVNNRGLRAAPFSCSGTGGSNFGDHISFVAPGDKIISLDYNDSWMLAPAPGCGTSDAVPYVSGLISLMFAVNPLLTYEQVYDALKAGARDQIGLPQEDTPGWDKYYGWGLIDAYKTLQSVPAVSHTYFAQAAVGGGFTTTFTLLNTGALAIAGNLILTGNDGTPLSVAFSSPGQPGTTASSYSIQVASGGTQLITATAVDPSTLSTGWARVESSGSTLSGVATFQLEQGGALTTIAGVLSAAETNSATIPIDDDLTLGPKKYSTGYAIANPGQEDININIVVLNQDGSVFGSVPPIPIAPGGHISRFLWQDLNDDAFRFKGSMVLTEQSGKTFSVVALVLNQGLYTAIPVIPGSEIGATSVKGDMFAQVAVGGGFTTTFTLLNTDVTPAIGNLVLTRYDGQLMNVVLSSPGQPDALASSFPVNVLPGGTQLITASAENSSDVTVGWAQLASSGTSLGGVATFQLISNGTLSTIAGVLSANATNVATIPINDDLTLGPKSYSTGYAIANPGSEVINVKIVVLNPDGSVSSGLDPIAINPGCHISRFLWQDLNDASFRFKGSMILTEQSGKAFSVVALVLNQGLYTAIPVIPAKAPGK
jgi:hypothetical protein